MARKTQVGRFTVSSIMETPFGKPVFGTAGETCVFTEWKHLRDSEVLGTYDDHDLIVRTLKFALGIERG